MKSNQINIDPKLQVPVHIVHDTHVHNGTFVTHSPYGLHASTDVHTQPEVASVSPLFAPPLRGSGLMAGFSACTYLRVDIGSEGELQGT